MVTGNFCLLAGIDPAQWMTGILVFIWMHCSGSNSPIHGVWRSTPTASFVGSSLMQQAETTSKKWATTAKLSLQREAADRQSACPLNSLYWHFMARHKDRFQSNHRMRMLYGTWNKMGDETQRAVLDQAEHYLKPLNSCDPPLPPGVSGFDEKKRPHSKFSGR